MPRLFVGLEMDDTFRDAAAGLPEDLAGARFVDVDDLHLTLRFVGDVDKATARELVTVLDYLDSDAFTLQFSGLGVFGKDRPHSLYIAVAANQALLVLQKAVERAVRRAGLPPDSRRFTPHVTIASLRATAPEMVARYIDAQVGLRLPAVLVSAVTLFSSRSGTGGGPYVAEMQFPLRGGEDYAASWTDDDEIATR